MTKEKWFILVNKNPSLYNKQVERNPYTCTNNESVFVYMKG